MAWNVLHFLRCYAVPASLIRQQSLRNLPQENSKISPIGKESSDHSAESFVHDLIDYLSLEIEWSILIEDNLLTLKKKYDIPDEYEMIVSDLEGQISEPPKSCIAFYDESLWFGLWFPLHPFFSIVFDFYKIHPTQITPNVIRMTIVFIIMYNFLHIDLRISLFRSLVHLKRYPSEKGWWYFSLWKNYKFGLRLLPSIHD